ncbi:RES domain-containing protein (plasmid) [Deinococcus psychrotolerans]|uniref:RES domain-containing protein n=1 Tax=Deinococcus psychrotolerans TaxID=2489213 RepID=A0A3G8YJ93_9DEIO|nr:RES family NAD+ phosphorylase [Deinococcus psychrotolerans]AZI45312.1 RES domain-containing protein [Deinococcus psychrotolerans]
MSLTLYRISKLQYAQHPDLPEHGFGAARFGGRWNSPDLTSQHDRRLIYTSDTLAQAMLEIVVHVDSRVLQTVPHAYVRFQVEEEYIADLKAAQLPATWNAHPETPATQVIGDQWFDEQSSPVLRVPSVILPLTVYGPGQSNYLINANHPDIGEAVKLLDFQTLPLDPRL